MKTGEATVVKNAGSHYLLSELPAWEVFPAVLRGKIRLKQSVVTNPIAVGDVVRYEMDPGHSGLDPESPAVITEILPRRNYVIRRSTNLSRQAHIIAANVDRAYLVVSLYFPEVKLPFLDRILVTCALYGIPPSSCPKWTCTGSWIRRGSPASMPFTREPAIRSSRLPW